MHRMVASVTVAGALLVSGAVMAAPLPVDLTPGNTDVGIFLKQFPVVTDTEFKIFLDGQTGVTLGTGHNGCQTCTAFGTSQFVTNVPVDLKQGFATIVPSAGSGTWNSLTYSTPGRSFTDLLFDEQLTKSTSHPADPLNFEIQVFNGLTKLADLNITGDPLQHDTDQSWLVLAKDGATFTSVVLLSNTAQFTGFNEQKHFEVSGVPVPPAIALFGSGLALLGGLIVTKRRQKGYRAPADDTLLGS